MNSCSSINLQGKPSNPQANFWSLDPQTRERVMVQAMFQNQAQIQALTTQGDEFKGRIKNLADQLKKEKASNEEAQSTINQLCKEKNLENYKRISEKISTCFPDKEDVWKYRVLSAILKINEAKRPEEIEKAICANRDVRCQLRKFLNAWGLSTNPLNCDTQRQYRTILLELAKLILRENPLISWEVLKSKLEKAGATLDKLALKEPDAIIVISKAAECLFRNIDISYSSLWASARNAWAEDKASMPDADVYEWENEWGVVCRSRATGDW